MGHYTEEQWLAYLDKSTGNKTAAVMEEHLLACDTCLGTYLGLLDTARLEDAKRLLPANFTQRVMEEIKKEAEKRKALHFRSYHRRLIGAYAAAACFTLLLTLNGSFSLLGYGFSNLASRLSDSNIQVERKLKGSWPREIAREITKHTFTFKINREAQINHEKNK